MGLYYTGSGGWHKTKKWLKDRQKMNEYIFELLSKYGKIGVRRLEEATPKDTGEAAKSWGYTINKSKKGYELIFTNTVIVGNIPLVMLLQYGHITGTGGYVEGQDYINKAVDGIFDAAIKEYIEKEVRG